MHSYKLTHTIYMISYIVNLQDCQFLCAEYCNTLSPSIKNIPDKYAGDNNVETHLAQDGVKKTGKLSKRQKYQNIFRQSQQYITKLIPLKKTNKQIPSKESLQQETQSTNLDSKRLNMSSSECTSYY